MRLGCRDDGSDATAAVANATESVSAANNGPRRAPMRIGKGYLAETTMSANNVIPAAAIAAAVIAVARSRARTCSASRRASVIGEGQGVCAWAMRHRPYRQAGKIGWAWASQRLGQRPPQGASCASLREP